MKTTPAMNASGVGPLVDSDGIIGNKLYVLIITTSNYA